MLGDLRKPRPDRRARGRGAHVSSLSDFYRTLPVHGALMGHSNFTFKTLLQKSDLAIGPGLDQNMLEYAEVNKQKLKNASTVTVVSQKEIRLQILSSQKQNSFANPFISKPNVLASVGYHCVCEGRAHFRWCERRMRGDLTGNIRVWY